jgi:hypothetical protein
MNEVIKTLIIVLKSRYVYLKVTRKIDSKLIKFQDISRKY